jgi:hypothetical protein
MKRYQRPFLWLFLFVLISVPVGLWAKLPKSEVDKFFLEAPVVIEENVLAKYPDDLEISIDKGKVGINKPLPYCLTIEGIEGEKIGVVFDEKPETASLMQKENKYSGLCSAVALVGENYVVFPDDEGFKVQEIPAELSLKINKDQLKTWVEKFLPMVKKWGLLTYKVVPFLLVPIVILGMLLKNLWYAFILKMAGKMFKIKKMHQGEAYKISLLVFTGWSTISWVIRLLIEQTTGRVVNLSPFVFFNTILITAISLLLIKNGTVNFSDKKEDVQTISRPVETKEPPTTV